MGLSAPWAYSLEIITLQTVHKLLWINVTSLSAPKSYSIEIIALQTVKNYSGLTQFALVPLSPTLFILLHFRQ